MFGVDASDVPTGSSWVGEATLGLSVAEATCVVGAGSVAAAAMVTDSSRGASAQLRECVPPRLQMVVADDARGNARASACDTLRSCRGQSTRDCEPDCFELADIVIAS